MLFPLITGGDQNRQEGQHPSVLASIYSGCHYCHNLKYELNNLLHTDFFPFFPSLLQLSSHRAPHVFITAPSIIAVPQIFLATPSYPSRKFQGCPKTLEISIFPTSSLFGELLFYTSKLLLSMRFWCLLSFFSFPNTNLGLVDI